MNSRTDVWGRLQRGLVLVRSLARRPLLAARLMKYSQEGDAASFALLLRRELPAPLVRSVTERLVARLDSNIILEFERDGTVWAVPCGDSVTGALLADGNWQGAEISGLIAWLRTHGNLPTGSTVLDIGANIGTTSIPFVQAGMRVVAVEPDERNCSLLRRNIVANKMEQEVLVVEAAILDEDGIVSLAAVDGAHGMNYVQRRPASANTNVDSMTIATLLARTGVAINDIALVWCDIEGAEGLAVRSGAELWAAGIPLFAEVVPSHIARFMSVAEFEAILREHFVAYVPSKDLAAGDDARPRPLADLFAYGLEHIGDVLLLPSSYTLR